MTEASPEESIFRILVASDNHLGFKENNPNRVNEAFDALEEIFILATELKADFVALGGDLFDVQRPSQPTTFKCMQILRKYTQGSGSVKFRITRPVIVDDRGEIDATTANSSDGITDSKVSFAEGRPTNFEGSLSNVKIPIFIIHGNHDPPGGSGTDFVSSLDLLEVAGLLNDIGKVTDLDSVKIRPVCLQKGETKIALYGFGHIRDARMHRLFRDKKVQFLRPEVDPDSYYSILLIHQNRYKGNAGGAPLKNSVREEVLPDFLDFVIWGHEHDCQIEPRMSQERFHIVQPGSTVITSLSKGESDVKHVSLFEICGSNARTHPIPLLRTRPFIFKDVVLSEAGVKPTDESVFEFLLQEAHAAKSKAEVLIDERQQLWETAMLKCLKAITLRNLDTTSGSFAQDQFAFPRDRNKFCMSLYNKIMKIGDIDTCQKPLLRIRVDHSGGFPTVANPKFGVEFLDDFANPEDILIFTKARDVSDRPGRKNVPLVELEAEEEDGEDQTFHLIFKHMLDIRSLELLPEPHLNVAVRQYVDKSNLKALEWLVEQQHQNAKETIRKEVPINHTDLATTVRKLILRISAEQRDAAFRDAEIENTDTRGAQNAARAAEQSDHPVSSLSPLRPSAKPVAKSKRQFAKKKADDIQINFEVSPTPKNQSTGAVSLSNRMSRLGSKKAPENKTKKRTALSMLLPEDDEELSEDSDEVKSNRKRIKRAAADESD